MKDKELCSCCGSPWIVNKKYKLCLNCNYKRLHDGKTQNQVRMEKLVIEDADARLKPSTSMYRQKSIKALSIKGERIQRAINAVYAKMDATQPMVCISCGNNRVTHSHIMPRSQYTKLVANPTNIVYHCVECHNRWEHGELEDVERMGNFDRVLGIIKELAPMYFFRRFGILLDDYIEGRKKTVNIL